jgi:hypothetical protein
MDSQTSGSLQVVFFFERQGEGIYVTLNISRPNKCLDITTIFYIEFCRMHDSQDSDVFDFLGNAHK